MIRRFLSWRPRILVLATLAALAVAGSAQAVRVPILGFVPETGKPQYAQIVRHDGRLWLCESWEQRRVRQQTVCVVIPQKAKGAGPVA